ncbi:hypothetical protein MML48_6g00000720 [Holotrichia oblita]|uniref:Uncharacterized protein n=1 Tax=Holotrichia oblita TaxID=644536 RepID=A0ACB9SZ32_HOLOL|nr:hypothetical protein MML48_6g00000720 [Holotrichia oblita]
MLLFYFQISTSDAEIASVRGELEIVQRALKLQTKRCRQLVAEYTRRLQEKEQQYQCERNLRNDQLAKVLRALLIFEARLRQEQKYISHQLNEKDYIIKKQRNDFTRLMSSQYCKHCNQYYSPASNLESLDSSSEYVVTDYQDYQSSNFESLDSSSETYATISEKEYDIKSKTPSSDQSYSGEDNGSSDRDMGKVVYQKNKFNKDSLVRRARKFGHRKSVGTYFEVLKLRNESPTSNEDNTSNDYENLDSLPPESITDKISVVSERIENMFADGNHKEKDSLHSNSSSNGTDSDCNNTVIQNCKTIEFAPVPINFSEDSNSEDITEKKEENCSKISQSIPVFEGDGETNDKWYASGSEQEDDEQRDIYRNNPVLECMNQILLHNINDATISPPKTPTAGRKFQKNKRVKFSDEEENINNEGSNLNTDIVTKENVNAESSESKSSMQGNYYETPIQKQPNFYETPQSIYSNDYEQILSKCSESFSSNSPTKLDAMQEKEVNMMPTKKLNVIKNIDFESNRGGHYYDMDTNIENENELKIVRKSKILRTPPALPPKPTNLVSKYKLQNVQHQHKTNMPIEPSIESEPDYCSISELNLPPTNNSQKINVVAEINLHNILDTSKDSDKHVIVHKPQISEVDTHYDPVIVNEDIANLVSKNIEKFNLQLTKQTTVKAEIVASPTKPKPKPDTEIPKLPQVSEIIIPEENEEAKQDEERINQDNYVKNNSQILLKLKGSTRNDTMKRPIVMGTSVSNLITGFNNHKLLSEIHQPIPDKPKTKVMFPGFEQVQNSDKHGSLKKQEKQVVPPPKTLSFDKFDLSQNFEEFKLEDCQIGEEYDIDNNSDTTEKSISCSQMEEHKMPDLLKSPKKCMNSTRVELVRATNNLGTPKLNMNTIQQFRKKLELQKQADANNTVLKNNAQMKCQSEPTYEHFLECTGLSSKSILTPSRLLSNHKSMLKPKDVKLRSKVKSNSIFERHGSTIKYWSEPYI